MEKQRELNILLVDERATVEDFKLVEKTMLERSNDNKESLIEMFTLDDLKDESIRGKMANDIALADRIVVVNALDPFKCQGNVSQPMRDLVCGIQDQKAVYYIHTPRDFSAKNNWSIELSGNPMLRLYAGHIAKKQQNDFQIRSVR